MKLVEIFQQRNPDHMLTMRGQDMPTTDMVKVASFETDLPTDDALSEAFRLTNHDSVDPSEANPRLKMETVEHASLSVGDVVVVDGNAFQCVKRGWKPLDSFKA